MTPPRETNPANMRGRPFVVSARTSPASAFLIAVVELCERFAYYGAQGLFQNYINNKPNGDDGSPGLGLGHKGATGLNLFFQWFCYGT